jgi:hypothetical protein
MIKSTMKAQVWQNGNVGRNLTTHSTGRGMSLPVIENLGGFGVVSRAG